MVNILLLLQLALSLLVQAQHGTEAQKTMALNIAQSTVILAQQYIVAQTPTSTAPIYEVTIQPPIGSIVPPQIVSVPVIPIQEPTPQPTPPPPAPTITKVHWDNIAPFIGWNISFTRLWDIPSVMFLIQGNKNDIDLEFTLNGETKIGSKVITFSNIEPLTKYPYAIKIKDGNTYAELNNELETPQVFK